MFNVTTLLTYTLTNSRISLFQRLILEKVNYAGHPKQQSHQVPPGYNFPH
jgi:hypothetical protein